MTEPLTNTEVDDWYKDIKSELLNYTFSSAPRFNEGKKVANIYRSFVAVFTEYEMVLAEWNKRGLNQRTS